MLCIWDAAYGGISLPGRSSSSSSERDGPRLQIEQHTAAVKALSWCPWSRYTLASGGGTADRTIRMWNSHTGANLKCVDTGSQVCSIQWSDTYKELVSSHGFSDYQLILWKYPSMTKVREFRGHSSRVLHLAKSPDGSTICSASADETIRFWELFGSSNNNRRSGSLFSTFNTNSSSSVLSQGLLLR
jgi:cell division cycle protein 20 (cofactor of APC complex)